METKPEAKTVQIDALYRKYWQKILGFISSRIDNRADAENLAQDVWVRIIESESEIYADTAQSYIYKIAVNIINDYLRQRYARPVFEVSEDLWNEIAMVETPQETLEAMQLAQIERERVKCLPPQRRIIYMMSRFEELPVLEIADRLSLSSRTVENHLRLGRHDVRDYIKALA